MKNKNIIKKIMVIGPMSSGHIQRWITPLTNIYNFEIVTLHSSTDVPENVKVHNLRKVFKNRLDFFINIPYLLYMYLKIKPDLVHVHFLSSYGIMASFLPQSVNKILSIWGTDLNGKPTKNKIMRFLAKQSISKYNVINVPAYHMKDKLKNLFGFENDSKVFVFQYGIELNKLPTRNYSDESEIKFASVRNWDDLYHITDFIKSFTETENERFKLYIYGKGGEYTNERINQFILDLNDPRIVVMGFVKRADMLEQLRNMDVVVSIPDKDGAPLSLMESMYIGLYPLVSSIDANHELLDSNTATFIASYDKNEISDAILKSSKKVRNPSELNYMVENRARICKEGDYEVNIKKMNDIYIDLLS